MANSFGSFGPAGPGFGSIQNAPAMPNPTAFPTAPSSSIGGGGAPTVGGGGLGNMVGAQVSPLPQAPSSFQAFRAPAPLPAAPAAAAPSAAPAASALNYGDPVPSGGQGQPTNQYLTVGGGQYSGLNSNLAGFESGSNAPTYQIPNSGYQQAWDAYQKSQQPGATAVGSQTPSLFGMGGL